MLGMEMIDNALSSLAIYQRFVSRAAHYLPEVMEVRLEGSWRVCVRYHEP